MGALDAYKAWCNGDIEPMDPPAQVFAIMRALAVELAALGELIGELAATHDCSACGCRRGRPCVYLTEASALGLLDETTKLRFAEVL